MNYEYYRTQRIVKNKIESFSLRFSIFYNFMSSDCDLSHAHPPRNRRLLANKLVFVFRALKGQLDCYSQAGDIRQFT